MARDCARDICHVLRHYWCESSVEHRQQRASKGRNLVDGSLPVNFPLFDRKLVGKKRPHESSRASTMNLSHASKLFGTLLFVGIMWAGFQCYAHTPLQHPARGVIQRVDHTNRTLVLMESKTGTNCVFLWKNFTRFRRGWHKASPDLLRAGQSIKVSYQRDIGRLVLYEVRWSETGSTNLFENASTQTMKGSQQSLRENLSKGVSTPVTETPLREKATTEKQLK